MKDHWNLSNYQFNIQTDSAMLERLFPGSTVYWDIEPTWEHYYLRIRPSGMWNETKHNTEMELVAFKCIQESVLETIKTRFSSIPIIWKYTGPIDKWKDITAYS